jgi:hypothetical protein
MWVMCPGCGRSFPAGGPGKGLSYEAEQKTEVRPKPPALAEEDLPGLTEPRRPPDIPGYLLGGELGQGGMGVVYKAVQRRLQRVVALKMAHGGPRVPPENLQRFRAEAAAVARLQHPNIVQVYEVGEHEGVPFFSLEFVDGPTLARRLAGTPQPGRAAAGLVEVLARAVHVAHQHGVVHRDLKPGNILLAPPALEAGRGGLDSPVEHLYGVPKIADFGLAKRLDEDAGQTNTGDFVGTPGYSSPEQAGGQGQAVGPATDVHALGVILYEMLTGRPPFLAENALETLRQVAEEEAVPPRRLRRSVPRDLEVICLKCLAKDPKRRYASALALAEDLRRYLDGGSIEARPLGPVERLRRWCGRYPVAAGLLVTVVLCLVFGFWYLAHLSEYLVRSAALDSAAQQAELLSEVNDSYADVVKRAQAGHLTVTHDYHGNPAAIPIPATFTIELGQQISDRSETGVRVRLYSDFPFRSRRNGGPRDNFERDALDRLRADPATPVYRFEDFKGRPALRYATARLMQESCVECHNNHPDSPRTDWKVGDVRGVVEIIRPLDRDVARTGTGLRGASILMAVVCLTLLGSAAMALLMERLRRGRNALP